MPTVPVPSYEEFPQLKRPAVKRDLLRLVKLTQEKRKNETAVDNVKARLIPVLLETMQGAGIKSFAIEGEMVSAYQGEPRRKLDVDRLLKLQIQCPCGCKAKFQLPAKYIEAATVEGATPKPTVSVRAIAAGKTRENGGE